MHEKTFVGQSDTLAQIHRNFHQEIGSQEIEETEYAAPTHRECTIRGKLIRSQSIYKPRA